MVRALRALEPSLEERGCKVRSWANCMAPPARTVPSQEPSAESMCQTRALSEAESAQTGANTKNRKHGALKQAR